MKSIKIIVFIFFGILFLIGLIALTLLGLKEKKSEEIFLSASEIVKKVAPYESAFLFDENKVLSGKGYSPHVLIGVSYMPYDSFRDLAKDICQTSGNYHLITMEEWGIVSQTAKGENLIPGGNNDRGFSKEMPGEECELDPKKERTCLTGTGPESWCYQGVCDLNGNLSEWVDFPDVVDGVVRISDKEFTLVPANYDMEKALTKKGVENLIEADKDPNPSQYYVSGASVMIDTSNEEYDYPINIPIKKDTTLGDFDQFRNGDGELYGDGKYYLWVPTYDMNNNNNEDGARDVSSEILVCDSFDGKSFKDCANYRGINLSAPQVKENQRISSVIPSLVFPSEGFDDLYILQLSGFASSLRGEPELEKMAIPASISARVPTQYDDDVYKIAAYGTRYAVRGGGYDDGTGSGLFYLELLIDQSNLNSWNITYRCVENYKIKEEEKPSLYVSQVKLLPVISQESPSLENTWAKVLEGENNEIFYSIDVGKDSIYIAGIERSLSGVREDKAVLSRLDSQGKISWSRILTGVSGNPVSGAAFSVKITDEDSAVMTGWLQEGKFKNNKEDIFLVKIDKDGVFLLRRVLGGQNKEFGYSVALTKDEGYLITGTVFRSVKEDSDILVIKLDKLGNILWSKTFDNNSLFDIAYSAGETSDGGFIIGGRSADKPGQEELGIWHYFDQEEAILIKLDKDGNLIWGKSFGGNFGNSRIFSLRETLDHAYLIGGETYSRGILKGETTKMPESFQSKLFLLKLNQSGEPTWGKTFGVDRINLVMSLTEDKNGNYIAVTSSGPTLGGIIGVFNAGVFKFNKEGEVLSKRMFAKSGNDTCFGVSATEDGGYIAVGKTKSFGKEGNDDGLLLKFTAEGDIKDCISLKTPDESSFFFQSFPTSSIKDVSLGENPYALESRSGSSLLLQESILEETTACPLK